jgi:sulfur-carrier protein adenylyltransferase/sulfurtransferase
MFTSEERERYQSHMAIPEFGEESQRKLKQSKILVIGAGGLGCPVLEYLSAAGIGMLGLIDGSSIRLSDLHRQILYSISDIGQLKAETATRKLRAINNNILYNCYPYPIDEAKAKEIIPLYDVIVVATNNSECQQLVAAACIRSQKKMITGSAKGFLGQVASFDFKQTEQFEQLAVDTFGSEDKELGVMGFTVGIVGSILASEAIKAATGIGQPLYGKRLQFDALTNEIRIG